jgi:hypothetical protein
MAEARQKDIQKLEEGAAKRLAAAPVPKRMMAAG